MKKQPKLTQFFKPCCAIAVAAVLAVPSAFAASQTWSSTPTDQWWTNAANWVGGAAPGTINQTGNSVNNDVVTFNSPLSSGIGGVGNPILTDDATAISTAFPRSRTFGGITFDTPNVGAYVIQPGNPVLNITDTNFVMSGIYYVSHNGSIQMTAGVTNSQTILAPLGVRLPSSTAGIYNLVNNSTNSATLYISAITNFSANTRGTDFRLGGSNTGANTVGFISAGTTTVGANGLTKQGSGTWILPNENDLRTGTFIQILDGTLIAQNDGVFSIATTANVSGSGVLQLDGVNLFQPSLNLNNGGTIRMNGTASLNGINVGAAAGTQVTLATTSVSDVFTVGTGFFANSIVAGGAADTVLHTTGPGSIYLSSANTYLGNWSFDSGTVQVIFPGVLGTGANANVGAGAVFDFSLQGPVSYTPSVAGFGGSGAVTAASVLGDPGATLDLSSKTINLTVAPSSASGDLTRPALTMAQGTLALGGNTFVVKNLLGTPLGVGTYRLIAQTTGSVTSGGGYGVLFEGNGVAVNTAASISVSGGNVDLVIVSYIPKSLVWNGAGADWQVGGPNNWNNGGSPDVFSSYDNVTFNATGTANPNVNLIGTLAPSSVAVDTTAGDYSFAGAGKIAGSASLVKSSAGVFSVANANTYAGGTVVNGGTLRLAASEAVSSTGSGDLTIGASGTFDLNGFNNTINALQGAGTVDVQTALPSALTVGNNDQSGSFSGTITDSDPSAILALVKVGTGTQTLGGANSFSGGTTVALGTLDIANPAALGGGNLTVNAGAVNLQTGLTLNSLAGSGGAIGNNSNTSTNRIRITGSTDTTFGGNITDGTGGGGVGLTLLGGTLTMSGQSTYTGGTYVGSAATLAIPNSPAAVGGFVIASNNASLFLSGGSGTPGTPNSITTVNGAKVIFNSGAEGKIWQAQFNGGANTTNRFIGPTSAGQSLSFSNFFGVVEFANTNDANLNFRFFNGGGISGGENTLFVFERVNVHTRDAQSVRLGAIAGGNSSAGIGDQASAVSWEIGAKNTSMDFHGYISGVNNSIAKVGSGVLTLDGRNYYTNQVTLPDTSVVDYTLFTNAITYRGTTTISNGTLKIVAPNNLTNSVNITLAGGVLDATQIGYATNQTTLDINAIEQPTNAVVVTSSVVQILAGQSLNGQGSILGSVTTDPAATVNVGQGIGTLAISGSASLAGTINMDLDRSNLAQNSDRLTAGSFSVAGATLNVSNAGPVLIAGAKFQLFGAAVSGFGAVNLPTSDPSGVILYSWQNDLGTDGSITLLTGVNPTPGPLNFAVSGDGSSLDFSWPSDQTGWLLQVQTNALDVGISNNWFPVAGSTLTNQVTVPVDPANPTVFYRLDLPLP